VKENFWFYLLAAFVTFVASIQSYIAYKRKRVKYNLVTLVTNIVVFMIIILVYFTQWSFLDVFGSKAVKISLMIVIGIVILVSLFSKEIMQFIHKLKKK
jgi:hypothetical protein